MDSPSPHAISPLLARCPPTLASASYFDPAIHRSEMDRIWARSWLYAGRASDLPAMTMRRVEIAGQNLILLKSDAGEIACFHNTCRHRGSELCPEAERRLSARLITCPYHQWSYDLTGRLARIPFATPTAEFRKEDHGLLRVPVREWNGCLFVCPDGAPPDFETVPDPGTDLLEHWPMADLVTGHVLVNELACNWKIFWENYNECLHCPGTHPELCDLVPIYRKGVMADNELADWTPAAPQSPGLRAGARSWTVSGRACGPEFPRLTESERIEGFRFVTLLPSLFLVAHVDHVRAVSLRPLGPERTELRAEWLFSADTLKAPDFDLEDVVGFASTVIRQDAAACEMNQRGLRSGRLRHGTLMPQEFEIHRFHDWIRRRLETGGDGMGGSP